MCPTGNTHNYIKKNKKMCGFSQRCVSLGVPMICFDGFSNGIHQNIKKNRDIGECVGVPRNYSNSELKLWQDLNSIKTKNGSPSSLNSSLYSK